MAVADCSNIQGGETISYECHELDTYEELMELSLSCGEDTVFPSQIAQSDPNAQPGNPSWEACNLGHTQYFAQYAEEYEPSCSCQQPNNDGIFQLQCVDGCKTCVSDDLCYTYSFTQNFDLDGEVILYFSCDDDFCYFEDVPEDTSCFAFGNSDNRCVCTNACDVDCSGIAPGVVFNQCTGEGNFGQYEEYAQFYQQFWVENTEYYAGECQAESEDSNAAMIGGIVGGVCGALALVAAGVLYRRRRKGSTSPAEHYPETASAKHTEDDTTSRDTTASPPPVRRTVVVKKVSARAPIEHLVSTHTPIEKANNSISSFPRGMDAPGEAHHSKSVINPEYGA